MTVFGVLLEARDPERNRWRSYRVEAGRDLFGTWLVEVTFGRIGSPRGRTVRYVAGDEQAAAAPRTGLPAPPWVGAAADRRRIHHP